MTQKAIDAQNRAFWDDLCGTWIARALDITEITPESLARFDHAYMAYYPYLARYVEALPVDGSETLEIGLGFGTIGQILAARGARYHGVDIAAGPVAMMRDRLRWSGQPADETVLQASTLELPWDGERFDVVVSIGCLHHTGDLPRAVDEVHRVLRAGGTAFVMLYNAYSLRQLTLPREQRPKRARGSTAGEVRAMYDVNSAGAAAPHTDFVSRRDVRRLFRAFSSVSVQAQNIEALTLGRGRWERTISRERLLGNLARILGLDLYIQARK